MKRFRRTALLKDASSRRRIVLGDPIDAQFFSEVFDPPPFLPSMGVRQLKPALELSIAEFLSSQPAPVNRETIVAAVASRYAEAYPAVLPRR